jgi:tetratricopeptide (TPR) repeat protein
MKKCAQFIFLTVFICLSFSVKANKIDNQTCGIAAGKPLTSGVFGPYDYRDPTERQQRLSIVEGAHFTREVETLMGGANGATGGLADDIHYTLRKFPNHHRALNAMGRLQRRQKIDTFKSYQMHCYFARAKYFSPTDATVLMLEGMHYHLLKDYNKANASYQKAVTLDPEHAEIQYNYGLLLFDMGRYGEARTFADKALANNYPMRGLQNRLSKITPEK